jgi:hypothetical protein
MKNGSAVHRAIIMTLSRYECSIACIATMLVRCLVSIASEL